MRIFLRLLPLLVISLALAVSAPAKANLVLNPGFELGGAVGQGSPIVDWTSHSAASAFGWGVGNADVHSGSFAAVTGCSGQGCLDPVNGTFISQALPTTAGQNYNLTFWSDSRVQGSGPSTGTNFVDLDVYWDGVLVLSLPNTAPGYTEYTVDGLLASTNSTVLQFNGRNDPILIWLDDVDVEATAAAVPEPSSLILVASGLFAFGMTRGRRRGATA